MSWQDDAPYDECFPREQVRQDSACDCEYLPEEQVRQAVASEGAYSPAEQVLHDGAPAAAEYFPAGQI